MQLDRARFALACKKLDRTFAWAARRAGISKQRLDHYLNGRPVPQPIVVRIIAALGTADILADDITSTRTPMIRPADPPEQVAA